MQKGLLKLDGIQEVEMKNQDDYGIKKLEIKIDRLYVIGKLLCYLMVVVVVMLLVVMLLVAM